MSSFSEDKLLPVLAEILSDIRQIKSDLRVLLTLLQHQQNPRPARLAEGDPIAEPNERGSTSPEEVLRYLRETRGEDYTGE
jgi:hypothetical protein